MKVKVVYRLAFILINIGLFFSRFALSVGMIILVINIIFLEKKHLRKKITAYCKRSDALIFESIFFIYLLSGFYSQNVYFYLERIQLVLPLLVLPLSFSVLRISKKEFHLWLGSFMALTTLISCLSFINYIWNGRKILAETGPLMSAPIDHIHLSLAVAISSIIGVYLLVLQNRKLSAVATIITFIATSFLLFYLHINGVRSGILGFYIGLILFCYMNRKQITLFRKMVGCVIFLLFVGLLFTNSPHFRYKIINTAISITECLRGQKLENPSDFGRIASMQKGIDVGKSNILFGVGLGDIKDAMYKQSAIKLLPHNQFVFIFAFAGLFGVVVFTISIVRLLLCNPAERSFFIAMNGVFLSAFWVSHPIERQVGLGLFLYFNLLCLCVLKPSKNKSQIYLAPAIEMENEYLI